MAEINTTETISEGAEVDTEVTATPEEKVPESKAKDKKSAKKKSKQPNFFVRLGKRIAKFFREYNSERKKVAWKPVREVFKSLGVVVVTVVAFSLAIFVIDLVFGNFFEWIPEAINFFFKK